MKKLNKKLFVGLNVLVFLIIATSALAVLPPKYYKEAAEKSKIKAVATVTKVKVLEETKRRTFKRVYFKLEKSLSKDVPETFSGTCYSVDHKWQDPGVGGIIYYYPKKGARVLVTILDDGSKITTYSEMTPELEKKIKENPKSIEFVMGHAR